ncbi:MAG: UDP binding domain-containing protein, partial [Hyphomicrobiaceae bacterium]
PEVILAGRRINDGMGAHVVDRVTRLMMKRGFPVVGSRVLVMGLTFKENCPDLRNSRVVDVIRGLRDYNASVDVWDPCVDPLEAHEEYDETVLAEIPRSGTYDAIVLAVSHREFADLGAARIRAFGKRNAVLFDVKGMLARDESDGRL